MLLQHEDNVLRLFPDWPRSKDASFTHLRAKGAFLVSSKQVGGQVTEIEIHSEHGGPLTVQSPWGDRNARINRRLQKPDMKGQIYYWMTVVGGSYQLFPQ